MEGFREAKAGRGDWIRTSDLIVPKSGGKVQRFKIEEDLAILATNNDGLSIEEISNISQLSKTPRSAEAIRNRRFKSTSKMRQLVANEGMVGLFRYHGVEFDGGDEQIEALVERYRSQLREV